LIPAVIFQPPEIHYVQVIDLSNPSTHFHPTSPAIPRAFPTFAHTPETMKKTVAILLLFAATLTATAQDKKPITHEDMWLLKRVGAPAISPDGKWTIFSVVDPAYDEKEQVNDIWIAATDGSSDPRRLTATKAGESGYAWSPDGKYIAFTARRDGEEESQVYLLNIKDGGEAQKLTSLSTGASGPKWSPDSKMILFTSSVFPNCYEDSLNKKKIEEKKKQKYKARVYTSFPIQEWDHWLDEKQSHPFVQAIAPGSKARDLFTDVAISRLEGFGYSTAIWSADSKEIIFSASTDLNKLAYQYNTTDLYKVAVSGGDATKLTNDKNEYNNPVLSPDGKYLFCYTNPANAYNVYNLNRLCRFDWPSMQNRKVISDKLDRPINMFFVRGTTVYMSVEDQGRDRIMTLPVNGGTPVAFDKTGFGSYTTMSASEKGPLVYVASFESAMAPPEIVRINANGTHTPITKFNAEKLAKMDLQPVETIWFKSSAGKNIRSLLVKPAGFDANKKYPLFVVMHGGPAGAWKEAWTYRWNYHLLAKPGYVLLMTDYTGSTGYGEKFAQDIINDPFKGPATEINEAAEDAIKRFSFIDGTKQAAGGGSYGGHLANWMEGTTTHYKCLISHAGAVNSVSQWGTSDGIYHREVMNGGVPWENNKVWKEQNPFNYAANFKTPMLVTVGEMDFRVPYNNSIENWHILQRQQVPGKLIIFPEENHWINKAENSRFFYKEVHAWLEKYLK
jgi:dipeptidyl aminopeptidase/acylaminoacyl peptidase